VVVDVARRWGIGPMSPPREQLPPAGAHDEPVADPLLPTAEDPVDALPADPNAARAFVEVLFARHHGEIYAYLIRMLRDPELAADLAQDAFIRAYRGHASLEDPTKARAWLYQIANRVALDEIRRRKIVRFIPWTGESRGAAPSAERLAMDTRFSGELERALARIPERQRSALLLAEVHDLSGVELAAALGTSHVAARALLTRARESLRRALAEERILAAEAEAAGRPLDRPAARGTRPDGRG
jgi:RNA polymerase sigma-70 factor (ECF subfamily)